MVVRAFDDIFIDCTSLGIKLKTDEYMVSGQYAIIDQGQHDIVGYTDRTDGVFADVPAIIFGDHTRAIKYADRPFFLGADGVKLLKAKEKTANYKYLYYALRSIRIPNTGYNRHFKWLKESQIKYPDAETQQKVVDVLDKIAKTIVHRKQQLSAFDTLVRARFVEMFGDPVENAMGWEKKKLQELVTDDCTISYGIVQTGDDQEDGVPVFRPVDIVNRIPVRAELKKTTEEISNKYKRTILKGREMLITVRANIADTCIVGGEFVGCNVGRGIVPIRTKEDIMLLEFLKHQIDNQHLNDKIKAMAKGITLIQLNMEDLREVELVVPPIDMQRDFIAFVEQLDKSKLGDILERNIMEWESRLEAFAKQFNILYEKAYDSYKNLAENICSREASEQEVALLLDYMMDFCGSEKVLFLFKKVCRSYYERYPETIAFEINTYRELYDTVEEELEHDEL